MPATSKAQQQAAAIALHRPEKAKTDMGDMKRSDLRKFAATPRKGLPKHVKHESLSRSLFERDDVSKLNIGATGKKFARMTSKEAFKTTDGTDEKWKTSLKLRAELGGESPSTKMKSKDAVGKVPHAFKESRAQRIVDRLLA